MEMPLRVEASTGVNEGEGTLVGRRRKCRGWTMAIDRFQLSYRAIFQGSSVECKSKERFSSDVLRYREPRLK